MSNQSSPLIKKNRKPNQPIRLIQDLVLVGEDMIGAEFGVHRHGSSLPFGLFQIGKAASMSTNERF